MAQRGEDKIAYPLRVGNGVLKEHGLEACTTMGRETLLLRVVPKQSLGGKCRSQVQLGNEGVNRGFARLCVSHGIHLMHTQDQDIRTARELAQGL
jgi:hypothetical protein